MDKQPTRGRVKKADLLPDSIRKPLLEMLREKRFTQVQVREEINRLIEEAGLPDDMKLSRGGNDIRTLGFMSESIAVAVAQRTGEPPARLLAMSGKNVLHADSDKHHLTGVALQSDDFQLLPALLARPEAILWDKHHNNLMYIVTTKDGLAKIVVNAPFGIKRQPDQLDVIINTYRIRDVNDLKADIHSGKLELLEGKVD